MATPDDETCASIDAALGKWRQGDCVVEDHCWFVHRQVEPKKDPGEDSSDLLEAEVPGFVVITQSCDIVRRYKDRPFVSVSPLAGVSDSDLQLIWKGYRPQFGAIPGLSPKKLVADFDRVMTVDKQVVATWPRVTGCTTDVEARDFARAVARKHARFAFPDDFNQFVASLAERIREKHERRSSEGDALRGLAEIRVRAAPSWDAKDVELMFWFVAKPMDAPEVRKSGVLPTWESRIRPQGRFKRVLAQITTHEELTAQDYLESDQLDLDHLSTRRV